MKEPVRAVAGGVAVGIANVIPGVSGGTMMAIMNIFNRTMDAISGITKKDNKNRMKDIGFLSLVLLGTVAGIIGFSKLIEWLFGAVPMPTVFWFVGLVALSVPVFLKNQMNGNKVHAGGLVAGVLLILALTVVKCVMFPEQEPQIDPATGEEIKQVWDLPAFSLVNSGLLLLAGTVSGFAMLLPGVSGSLVLMLLGLYETVYFAYINNASELFKNLSIDTIIKFVPAGFFAIGVLLGIVLSAKLTKVALAKNERVTLSFLLGLIAASAVSIIAINTQKYTADPLMILGSVGGFILGGVIVLLLGKVTSEG